MNPTRIFRLYASAMFVTFCCMGCNDKSDKGADTTSPQVPTALSNKPPPPSTAITPQTVPTPTASSTPRPGDDQNLALTGLTFTVPRDWVVKPIAPGPFAAKAAFRIPVTGSDQGCAVRITHYPSMKGKDDMNIDRWASQFRNSDGKPLSRDSGKVSKRDIADGKIRLTIAQFDGSMASGMSGSGSAQPDQRLVAAIVDHAQGPHFVKVTGSIESMKKVHESIIAFLLTAKIK